MPASPISILTYEDARRAVWDRTSAKAVQTMRLAAKRAGCGVVQLALFAGSNSARMTALNDRYELPAVGFVFGMRYYLQRVGALTPEQALEWDHLFAVDVPIDPAEIFGEAGGGTDPVSKDESHQRELRHAGDPAMGVRAPKEGAA